MSDISYSLAGHIMDLILEVIISERINSDFKLRAIMSALYSTSVQ